MARAFVFLVVYWTELFFLYNYAVFHVEDAVGTKGVLTFVGDHYYGLSGGVIEVT